MKRIAGSWCSLNRRKRRRKKDEKVRNSQPREDYVGIIGDPEGNLASMARLFVRVVPRDRTKKHTANLRPAADLFAPRITATCISFAEMRWIIARKVYRSCVPLRFSKGQVLLAWAIALQLLSLGRPVRILRRSVSFGRSDSPAGRILWRNFEMLRIALNREHRQGLTGFQRSNERRGFSTNAYKLERIRRIGWKKLRVLKHDHQRRNWLQQMKTFFRRIWPKFVMTKKELIKM